MAHTKYVIGADHPIVGTFCHGCGEELAPGMNIALIPIGPGPDPVARDLAARGQEYVVQTIAVCWPCITGSPE